jgi:hypothetical protein
MIRRHVRRAIALSFALALLTGCGQVSADLFTVTRDGSIPGAHAVLRVTDDGHVSCNSGPLREISSDELIRAREAARELEDPAKKGLSLPARPGSTLRYAVSIKGHTVHFADNSVGQQPEMYKAALLVRQLAKGPCGLPR